MILVGVTIERYTRRHPFIEQGFEKFSFSQYSEYPDVSTARAAVKRSNRDINDVCDFVVEGQFHDTETGRTWNVTIFGQSKGNYFSEPTKAFKKRWKA